MRVWRPSAAQCVLVCLSANVSDEYHGEILGEALQVLGLWEGQVHDLLVLLSMIGQDIKFISCKGQFSFDSVNVGLLAVHVREVLWDEASLPTDLSADQDLLRDCNAPKDI